MACTHHKFMALFFLGALLALAVSSWGQSPVALREQATKQMEARNWTAASALYSEIVRANPYSATQWHNYGYALHRSKQYEEAIRAWEKADELGFGWSSRQEAWMWEEAWVWSVGRGVPAYNIARAQAMLGHREQALRSLAQALKQGFNRDDTVRNEPDFAAIRQDARFRALLGIPAPGLSREEQWRFDLDYMARRMEHVHVNLYRKVSRKRFQGEVSRLKHRLPGLTDHQIVVEIMRIIAMAGDGHTHLLWPDTGPYAMPKFPIGFYRFKDGLFVNAAPPAFAAAVGGRVIRIGDKSVEEASKAVEPLCSVDGPMGYLAEVPRLLCSPHVLEAVGIIKDTARVPLVLEKADGSRTTVELTLSPPDVKGPWVTLNAAAKSALPLYRWHPDDFYWFEPLPEARLIYFQFNTVANKKDESFDAFCHRMMAFARTSHAENLVIDLRHNGGGDSSLNKALLQELLLNDTINRKGHLFTIIGRDTFSAAMNLVCDLESRTSTLFVGEPTLSGPNFAGQFNPITLPCSHLTLSCTSLNWQLSFSSDRRRWIEPDIVAELSSQDEANNQDPALQAILRILHEGSPVVKDYSGPGQDRVVFWKSLR